MQLEFEYSQGRPVLTAKLGKTKNNSKYFEFLIDSGADYTIIPQSDAEILGINYENIKSKEIIIEAANLTKIRTKEVRLTITIRDISFTIPVLISEKEVERLIGRKGLFDKFEITFKQKLNKVVLKET